MLQNALDLPVAAAEEKVAVPAWAADALSALEQQDIRLDGAAVLTRADAAQVIYRVHQIKTEAPGARVLDTLQ